MWMVDVTMWCLPGSVCGWLMSVCGVYLAVYVDGGCQCVVSTWQCTWIVDVILCGVYLAVYVDGGCQCVVSTWQCTWIVDVILCGAYLAVYKCACL